MLGFYGDTYGNQWELIPENGGSSGGNGYHLPPSGYFPDSEPPPSPGPTYEGPPPTGGPTPYDPSPGGGPGNGAPGGAAPSSTGPSTALYLLALGVAVLALAGGRRR